MDSLVIQLISVSLGKNLEENSWDVDRNLTPVKIALFNHVHKYPQYKIEVTGVS